MSLGGTIAFCAVMIVGTLILVWACLTVEDRDDEDTSRDTHR